MTEQKNAPEQMKLGRLRAKIWRNEKDGNVRYSADIFRTYRVPEEKREAGDEGWRDVHNFSDEDLEILPLFYEKVRTHIEKRKAND